MIAPVAEAGDPRLQAMFAPAGFSEQGIRPTVAVARRGVPNWVLAAGVAVIALMLFWVLESRRTTQVEKAPQAESAVSLAPPPPLYIPPQTVIQPVAPAQVAPQVTRPPAPMSAPIEPPQFVPPSRRSGAITGNAPMMPPPPPDAGRTRAPGGGGPTMVIDGSPGGPPQRQQGGPPIAGAPLGGSLAGTRARASSLANPAQTIAQGAVIPAVLETAFNSSQAGFARAIVSRDVRSFDGSKILIPRGSRLIGEYRAEVGQSQSRATILWTRLLRGDGVTIALNSPAVDPLGRGGVKAKVNNHLFQRVTNGLLQSIFSVASNLALTSSRTNVILAPGGMNSAPTMPAESQPMRTLTVPAGTSISVFVAQDLEFSTGGIDR